MTLYIVLHLEFEVMKKRDSRAVHVVALKMLFLVASKLKIHILLQVYNPLPLSTVIIKFMFLKPNNLLSAWDVDVY